MTGPQMVIAADDLTGATDTGACFANSGLTVVVPICAETPPEAEVLALNTNCRDVNSCDMPNLFHEALTKVPDPVGVRWWYKKIDSGLRGDPAEETYLLMEAAGFERAVIAPALPSEGRTVVAGQLFVNGEPLHTTSIGRGLDSSLISELFGRFAGRNVVNVGLGDVAGGADALESIFRQHEDGIWIVDAEADEDLLTIAEASARLDDTLFVGSAGFARQLASVLPIVSVVATPALPALRDGAILVVAGSRNESAARQIDALESIGAPVIRIPFGDAALLDSQFLAISAEITKSLRQGRPTATTTAGMPDSALPGQQIAHDLARIATNPIVTAHVSGMVLTGGDIAAAVCDRLSVDHLWLRGEVLPAVPWATFGGGRLPGLPVVTKAGSFGGKNTLVDCVDFLKGLSAG